MALPWALADDVSTRLQRPLSDEESALADAILEAVTGLIAAAAGKDLDWAEELAPVPAYFKLLLIDRAVASISNPELLRSSSATVGAISTTRAFRDADLYLSADEEARIATIVSGGARGSAKVRSLVDEMADVAIPDVIGGK